MKWSELLSIASSIATLTGVSLVWLSTLDILKNASIIKIAFCSVSAVVGSLLTIGIAFMLVRTFTSYMADVQPHNKVWIVTFLLPLLIVFAFMALMLVWGVVYFYWTIHY